MGVQAPQGYTTDSGSMSSQAGVIEQEASAAKSEVEDVAPTELNAKEFGQAHTKWHKDYAAAIDQLGAAATGMCTTLSAFAGRISQASESYRQTDEAQSEATQQAGRGL